MTDISAQHSPAVKVGGRRLSITARHRRHSASEPAPVEPSPSPPNTDYPRPAAPGEEQPVHNPPPHIEDEAPPKKEKKHWNHENEIKAKELAHRKMETTRPSKDTVGGNKGFGAGGRIAQPVARPLNI